MCLTKAVERVVITYNVLAERLLETVVEACTTLAFAYSETRFSKKFVFP